MSAVRVSLSIPWAGSPLARVVTLSAVGHVAAVLAMIFMPTFRSRPPIAPDAIAAVLVPLEPATARVAPPSPPPPSPVKSEPEPPPEGVRVETEPPQKPKPLPENPPPKPEPAPRRDPEPTAPAGRPEQTAADEAAAAADSSPVASSAGADAGVQVTGDVDFRFAWYRQQVAALLHGNWRRPVLDRQIEPLEVIVLFEIRRDGSVGGTRIQQTSGTPSLDRSALRAVADAAPFPPLPAAWDRPVYRIGTVFRLLPD